MQTKLAAISLASLILATAPASAQGTSLSALFKKEMYCSDPSQLRSIIEAERSGMDVPTAAITLNVASGKILCWYVTPLVSQKEADVDVVYRDELSYTIERWNISLALVIMNDVPIPMPVHLIRYKVSLRAAPKT